MIGVKSFFLKKLETASPRAGGGPGRFPHRWRFVPVALRAGGASCRWRFVPVALRAGGASCRWRFVPVALRAGGASCRWRFVPVALRAGGASCRWRFVPVARAASPGPTAERSKLNRKIHRWQPVKSRKNNQIILIKSIYKYQISLI